MAARLNILAPEDSPEDALLLKLAFEQARANASIHFVCDGEEAVAYLQGAPPFHNRLLHPLPGLLLLDLKMPRMNGFEFLEWLRCQPGLSRIPIVVLSGCEQREDISRARSLGADCFVAKPLGFAELVSVATYIKEKYSPPCAPVLKAPLPRPTSGRSSPQARRTSRPWAAGAA